MIGCWYCDLNHSIICCLCSSEEIKMEDVKTNEIIVTPLRKILERVEYECITGALKACGGNQSLASRMLEISRTTLRSKLKQYEKEDYR